MASCLKDSWWVFASLAMLLIGVVQFFLRRHYAYWEARGIPQVKPHNFVGSLRGIGKTYHWAEFNRRLYNKFKGKAPFIGIYMYLSKAAVVIDQELIHKILVTDFKSFIDRGIFHNVRDDILSINAHVLDGAQWKEMRSELLPIFNRSYLRAMVSDMAIVGEHLVKICGDSVGEGEVEMHEMFERYVSDVIARCVFGMIAGTLAKPNGIFHKMVLATAGKTRNNFMLELLQHTRPPLALNCRWRIKTLPSNASAFFARIVREAIALRKKNPEQKHHDFLHLFMSHGGPDEGGDSGWTEDQIAAQAVAFILLGFQQSASLLAFCLYEIGKNSFVQNTIRKNICRCLRKTDDKITYECVMEMNYLDLVLCEAQRKYPVVPHIVRQTVEDYKNSEGAVIFEKGLRIVIPIDAIHHDPHLYPDPELFVPTRFADRGLQQMHPASYIPFGLGPRECLGKHFGQLLVKIAIISLVKNFNITSKVVANGLSFDKTSFLTIPDGGVYVEFQEIQNRHSEGSL